jgi:hypothetical protein
VTFDGNTVTRIFEQTENGSGVNNGVTTYSGFYRNTTGLTISAGATVAYTIASNRVAKAGHAAAFTAAAGQTLAISGVIGAGAAGVADPPSLNPDDAGSGDVLAVVFTGREGAATDVFTDLGSWSIISPSQTGGAGGAGSVGVRGHYRITTGSGGGASAPTDPGANADYSRVGFLVRYA